MAGSSTLILGLFAAGAAALGPPQYPRPRMPYVPQAPANGPRAPGYGGAFGRFGGQRRGPALAPGSKWPAPTTPAPTTTAEPPAPPPPAPPPPAPTPPAPTTEAPTTSAKRKFNSPWPADTVNIFNGRRSRTPGSSPGSKWPAWTTPAPATPAKTPAPTTEAPAPPAEPPAPTTPAPATPATPKFNNRWPTNDFFKNFYGGAARGGMPTPVVVAPACTEEEAIVLRPLIAVTAAMQGKLTKNVTQMPSEAPQECHNAQTKEQLIECYYNWGFSTAAAECYAVAKMSNWNECGAVCGGPMKSKRHDARCVQCDMHIKTQRRVCVHEAAKINKKCTECQHAAYKSWDALCSMSCMDAFTKVRMNDPLVQCRSCNDRIYEATAACGI